MIRIEDLYWLAGFLEGEGSFGVSRQGRENGKVLYVSVVSVDKDVIDRVYSILGFGYHGALKPLPSGKTAYRWSCNASARAAGLMMTLLPLMGERRAIRIKESLAIWKATPLPRGLWTHCKHGHPLSGDNLRIAHEGKYEKRRCLECSRLRTAKYRLTKVRTSDEHRQHHRD